MHVLISTHSMPSVWLCNSIWKRHEHKKSPLNFPSVLFFVCSRNSIGDCCGITINILCMRKLVLVWISTLNHIVSGMLVEMWYRFVLREWSLPHVPWTTFHIYGNIETEFRIPCIVLVVFNRTLSIWWRCITHDVCVSVCGIFFQLLFNVCIR